MVETTQDNCEVVHSQTRRLEQLDRKKAGSKVLHIFSNSSSIVIHMDSLACHSIKLFYLYKLYHQRVRKIWNLEATEIERPSVAKRVSSAKLIYSLFPPL